VNLKDVILSVVSSKPLPKNVKSLFDEFNRMALAYLRKKEREGKLATHLFGISLEDLALDCIAELFGQNERGEFVRLKQYFGRLDLRGLDDGDLMSELRRLVFSEVSNQIFCRLSEADPNLHKLIRNLKDMKPTASASVEKVNESWTVRLGDEQTASLPLMPPEILECHLTPIVAATDNLREILHALAEVFADQRIYRREYPLVGFAHVLVSAFSLLKNEGSSEIPCLHSLSEAEIKRCICESILVVKSEKHKTYVGKGKIDEATFSTYFELTADFLADEYLRRDGNEESLFDRLRRKIEPLTEEQYEKQHKGIVNYLLKESRKVFLEKVKKEL
jgi:hypothetical protein